MSEPPGLLARRAVHQYRRRDAVAHAALRHHLRAACARRDGWAERVDARLVTDRAAGGYLLQRSFKETGDDGGREYRPLHLPGPSEIMAEAALLRACAEAGGPFEVPTNAYSYRLAEGDKDYGVFVPYWEGYTRRQEDVREACRRDGGQRVVYVDIRKFYPSVRLDVAATAWQRACDAAGLATRWTGLGLKMLEDQAGAVGNKDRRLLTGPMFSHLIGNLVLWELDQAMLVEAPERYFRYVDDIALVAPAAVAADLERRVVDHLGTLGLELHPNKRDEESADNWRRAEQAFVDLGPPVPWGIWLSRVKQAVWLHPSWRDALSRNLAANDIRVRPLDYAAATRERPFLKRVGRLANFEWFRSAVRRQSTTDALIVDALALRRHYAGTVRDLLPRYGSMGVFEGKRCRSLLRFAVGRLIYLAPADDLPALAEAVDGYDEFAAAAAVLRAVSTRDVTDLLTFGAVAAQTAARPLAAGGERVTCGAPAAWDDVAISVLASLHLEGLRVDHAAPPPRQPLLQLAAWGDDSAALFNSNDRFEREVACLHGLDDPDANRRANDEAFDRDDELALHVEQLMGGSS